ncbi:MAG: V-type ATP synthase subunit D [Nanoarchaeota archaeon]|nr:V-type ATP synthase subunit D [Nanoarchaeota archaeon]
MTKTVKTTMMELLRLKKKFKLAEKGHKLLKEKRDALISEFFKLVDDLKKLRKETEEKLAVAYQSLIYAQALMGYLETKRAADSVASQIKIESSQRNIMGVPVPKFECQFPADEMSYSVSTSLELDQATKNFREALKAIVQLAQVEASAVNLAEDIKKTKRKVNALEKIVMPRIKKDSTYIRMRLEEMERENFSRLKSIKARMEASENA